jgi:hypothetical protein
MNDIPLIAMMLLLGVSPGQAGPEHGLHGDISRPRIGVMSEQVVRQKLATYGLDVVALERYQDKYVARVQAEGKPQTLEINLLTGSVVQDGNPVRLQPMAKAIPLAIKPDPKRVPWVERTIRFEKIGVEGLRLPAHPTP